MFDGDYIVGIDEAGRGAVAGPVAVGACAVRADISHSIFEEVTDRFMKGELKDSKRLTEKKREEIFDWVKEKKMQGKLDFAVSMGSAKFIDKKGIMPTIRIAVSDVLNNLVKRIGGKLFVKLDGGLTAPDCFKNQETFIKGDETELEIALASIIAKHNRDEYMKKLIDVDNKIYEKYMFGKHKGYGTKLHYDIIKRCGMCDEYRASFYKWLQCVWSI